jgi:energy-coupling factor transporter ATP-binding protein EcfA2
VAALHIERIKFSALRGVAFYVGVGADIHGSDAGFHDMQRADLEQINVFGGRNGAGKSTLLDVVGALSRPELFQTLKRTAFGERVFHGLDITFKGDDSSYTPAPAPLVLHVEFEPARPPILALRVFDRADHSEEILDEIYARIPATGVAANDIQKISQIVSRMGINVSYWRGPEQTCFDAAFIVALREIQPELCGVKRVELATTQQLQETGVVKLQLYSDLMVSQAVPFEYLPSGWKAAAGMLGWLREQANGSIVIIEEPESHLHPRLQRLLAMNLARLAKEKNLQLLVSSHSSVFLSPDVWGAADATGSVSIAHFHVDGRHIHSLQGPRVTVSPQKLLDELGVRASDLYQSNFVIWVEGPSDRLYIKYWLQRWCREHAEAELVENVHYSFVLYGGSILSHYHAGEELQTEEAISMLRINRNSFVVIDRDHDFEFDGDVAHRTKKDSAKYKVLDQLDESSTWITRGYTVESYLPDAFKKYLVRKKNGAVSIGTKLTKVELAKKYMKETEGLKFKQIFKRTQTSAIQEVEKIFRGITRANL